MEDTSATLEFGYFRTRRLIKVIQFLNYDLTDKIESISDYKGTLTVKLNCELTKLEKLIFNKSWECLNELPENVIFEL